MPEWEDLLDLFTIKDLLGKSGSFLPSGGRGIPSGVRGYSWLCALMSLMVLRGPEVLPWLERVGCRKAKGIPAVILDQASHLFAEGGSDEDTVWPWLQVAVTHPTTLLLPANTDQERGSRGMSQVLTSHLRHDWLDTHTPFRKNCASALPFISLRSMVSREESNRHWDMGDRTLQPAWDSQLAGYY